ncbi:hypothetical protein [Mucilaginibacter myungsuensis]|uniref:Outer membrane protein with beta-barrel domain n=1 Tax=Mucilaginibacter myungsuensis TaxID=649104 RepID=A0A929KXB9_9SPHI|nr:hypothetical protein [Mucilaginibacter myungsuensis]MBE9662907.1 hypothetical protein [Mucilaginibacter myungsuensis]MDN3598527.1 hypothetical protein [Mucilaginibacter myungsuensis]
MKKLLLFLLLFAAVNRVSAQKAPVDTVSRHQQTISIQLGTQGIGAEYRYGLFSQLNLRAGIATLPVDQKNVFDIDDVNSKNDLSAKFTNIHLLAEVTPFKSFQFLRVIAGAASILKGNGHIDITPTDTYKYGDITLTPEQVGNLQMDINWDGICPYFGLGLVKAFPKNRFNINVDLGTYYLNKPTATFAGSGIFAGNSSQSAQLQKNVEDYRWLPVVQLNFNFKL